MEEGYVVIDQIPTRVITIGGWIDQPIKKRHLIIVIPGNPGLIGYYEDFVKSLYDELPDEYVIWGISHASHDIPKNTVLPTVKDQPELYTLDGQVKHKIKFIDTYVLTDVNVHFIGHSTGAKICIQLVKQYCKIHKAVAYLLFPTLARIAKTPNGWKLWPIAGPLRKLFVIAANLLNRLKESWKITIIQWTMRNKLSSENSTTSASGTPAIVPVNVRTSMSLLNPQALERSLFLARDQLKMVDELNAKDIRLHSDRLVLYFGTNDRWCPLEYCHNLLRQVPKARAIICPHEFEHAFVLQSSQQMATIVSEWIKEFS